MEKLDQLCQYKSKCEYGEYPRLCQDCKRNKAISEKKQKYDVYQEKDVKNEKTY